MGSPPVDLREEVVPIFEGLPIHLLRQATVIVDVGNGRQLNLIA